MAALQAVAQLLVSVGALIVKGRNNPIKLSIRLMEH